MHLWLRLARLPDLYHVSAILTAYRQGAGSETNSGKPPGLWDVPVYRDLHGRAEFSPWRRALAVAIGKRCLMDMCRYRQRGRRGRALVANGLGLRYAPGSGQLWRAAAGTLLGRD